MKKTGKCVDCGADIYKSSKRCRSCANTGENNPNHGSKKEAITPEAEADTSTKEPCTEPLNIEKEKLQSVIKELRKENTYLRKQKVTDEDVKKYLLEIKESPINPPSWTQEFSQGTVGMTGVPAIQLSDWHFGETVFPEQVFHKNEYNTETGMARVRQLCNNLIDVLTNHLYSADGYPGIVVCLNGDFFSGDIHDELTATNDKPIMPVFLDTFGILIWFLNQLEKR